MKNEIQLVASFGLMLIMMLSNFGLCGMVGVWLSSFFFGDFWLCTVCHAYSLFFNGDSVIGE